MNRKNLTGIIIGILAGFGLGYFVGVNHFGEAREEVVSAGPAMAAGKMPQMPPTGMPQEAAPIPGGVEELQAKQKLATLEAAATADPKNPAIWADLGNVYFDLQQPDKAVEAYGKALALAPNGPTVPDILTDQGVMYRALKQTDKAIGNFKQAAKLNPKHIQSLFNLGIVYSQDKNDMAAAKQAWTKLIEVAPDSPQAQEAKSLMAQPHNPHP